MKRQFLTLSFLLPAIVLMSISCSKNSDNNNPPPKTKTQLITTGSWKFQSASASGTDISNQNPPFEPCKKDNVMTFTVAGTGNINEGATKCNAADPDNNPFTWNFLNNETILHISTPLFSTGSSDFTVESISETQLVISQGYAPPVGAVILIKITFVH